VAALGGVLPATLTTGAVLEALGGILHRGLGLAAVTVSAAVAIAAVPPPATSAVAPESTVEARRRRLRTEARHRRRAGRLAQSPGRRLRRPRGRPRLVSWAARLAPGAPGRPPAGQLGADHTAGRGARVREDDPPPNASPTSPPERRALCVIDGKGADGLDEAIAAAVLAGG
jgi:hypothetical protein